MAIQTLKPLMTAAEFFKTGPETDGFELVRGELVPMPPPGDDHGRVCGNVVFLLKSHVKALGRGTVLCNDAGVLTRRDPDTVRGVDVAVFLKPDWQPPVGYTGEPPDLVVEVRSPAQKWSQVLNKVDDYLMMGVRLVWVLDPERRRVTVFTQDQEPTTFTADSDLDGGDILPGFHCKAAEMFE